MRLFELFKEDRDVTDQELQQLETYADKLFASLGIDVEFSRHIKDRVNDPRNQKPITIAELTRLFKQIYKKHGKPIAQLGPDAEAVMKDMRTDVNVPFALQWDGKELDLVAKTISMRLQKLDQYQVYIEPDSHHLVDTLQDLPLSLHSWLVCSEPLKLNIM